MRTELFDYDLPEELIAQTPLPRGQSRLLVIHRTTGKIEHRSFSDLPHYLAPSDLLVLNDTRVTGRRLEAMRENGLNAEVLLISPHGDSSWDTLVRPARPLHPGARIKLVGPDAEVWATIISETAVGGRIVELPDREWRDRIADWGHTPLPPYIRRQLGKSEEERYQTIYSRCGGSTAAPTAGLHFTDQLLSEIAAKEVQRSTVTLQIGIGTFRPVRSEIIGDHRMHGEHVCISIDCVRAINSTSGRIVAVGTTTVRALESAVNPEINPAAACDEAPETPAHRVRSKPFTGETNLFITPGYRFRTVDALVTNFHQPKSTLLMMVSAFAGMELIRAAYREAIENRYRFFSFGDAMMIL